MEKEAVVFCVPFASVDINVCSGIFCRPSLSDIFVNAETTHL